MYCAELTCGIEVQVEVDLVHGPVDQFSISYPEVLQLSDDIEQGKLASPYGIVGNGLDTQSQVWQGEPARVRLVGTRGYDEGGWYGHSDRDG